MLIKIIAYKMYLKEKAKRFCFFRLRPSVIKFPIVISQDGENQAVTEAISSFIKLAEKISFIHVSLFVMLPVDFQNLSISFAFFCICFFCH